MLNKIMGLLFNKTGPADKKEGEEDAKKRSRIAVCALLIEMANFDDDFHDDEKRVILDLVKDSFGLSSEEADELIELSEEERKKSVDIWHFTNLLNKNYSKLERIRILEMLWEVVYADERVHGNEDFLMRKIATLLKLEHKDLIGAKIRVKETVVTDSPEQ